MLIALIFGSMAKRHRLLLRSASTRDLVRYLFIPPLGSEIPSVGPTGIAMRRGFSLLSDYELDEQHALIDLKELLTPVGVPPFAFRACPSVISKTPIAPSDPHRDMSLITGGPGLCPRPLPLPGHASS